MDQQKIGKFISSLRKQKDLTQAELGDIVGVTGKAVSRWERGLSVPDVAIINKVSEVLGTTTTELLNGEKAVKIEAKDLDKITNNRILFLNNSSKQKFKKIITLSTSIFILIILILLAIFCFNNYDECRIYTIYSDDSNFSLFGLITKTNDTNKLVISNIKYRGDKLIKVTALNYELYINDKLVYFGSKEIELSVKNRSFDINKAIESVTIYLDSYKNYELDKIENFELKFEYIDDENDNHSYIIPLMLEKNFSNNKLMYF